MKSGFIALAVAASAFIAPATMADPFSSTVVATKIGYKSTQYTVKTGHVLNNIKIPVTHRPVRMLVTNTTPYYWGVGDVTMQSSPGTTLIWEGSDYRAAVSGTTDYGSAQGKGTHILWADSSGTVDVQEQDEQTIQVKNTSGEAQTLIITFMW